MLDIQPQIKAIIESATLRNLDRADYPEELLARYSIKPLKLDFDNVRTKIDVEQLVFGNVPAGFTFTPGKVYNYAQISVPVEGSRKYLREAIPAGVLTDREFFESNGVLYYKHFSADEISGNAEKIENIRSIARGKFSQVKAHLDQFNSQIERFNVELLTYIKTLLDDQRKKLKTHENSEGQLNPFK